MIKLEVKDYCQECREFKPVNYLRDYDEVNGIVTTTARTMIVECTNRKRCEHIQQYLERQVRKSDGTI